MFLDTNTDEKSFNDIIKILSNTVSKCSPTQSLSLEIHSCNNVVGNCIGSYDCLELINHLSSKVAIEANCRNEFWDNFKE